MCLKPFNTGQAEPLVFTRIPRPPILRRISGGNGAAIPPAIRWTVRRIIGGTLENRPPDCPARLTVNLRSVAGRFTSGRQASRRSISWKFPPHCRRPSAATTATRSGHPPITFTSYARH